MESGQPLIGRLSGHVVSRRRRRCRWSLSARPRWKSLDDEDVMSPLEEEEARFAAAILDAASSSSLPKVADQAQTEAAAATKETAAETTTAVTPLAIGPFHFQAQKEVFFSN